MSVDKRDAEAEPKKSTWELHGMDPDGRDKSCKMSKEAYVSVKSSTQDTKPVARASCCKFYKDWNTKMGFFCQTHRKRTQWSDEMAKLVSGCRFYECSSIAREFCFQASLECLAEHALVLPQRGHVQENICYLLSKRRECLAFFAILATK